MKLDDKKLLELGKQVAIILDMSRASRKTMMINSFLRGLAQGFGAIVGGTILVALLIWVLGFFNEVPLLGEAADVITDTVQRR